MTTTVTDGITIASDSQADSNGIRESGTFRKIIEKDGRLFAFSGPYGLLAPLVEWYIAGAKPADIPQTDKQNRDHSYTFWAFDNGHFLEFCYDLPYPVMVSPPAAIGSGREVALGAVSMGATPEQAVWAAIQWDTGSGGAIQVVTLPEHLQIRPAQLQAAE